MQIRFNYFVFQRSVTSLAGSDIDYLNEMYKSGIKDYYNGLAMHPYTSSYPQGTTQ